MHPDKQTSQFQERPKFSAFIDMRLELRTSIALFWGVLMLILILNAFAPSSVSENGWLKAAEKIMLNSAVAIWLLADGRARNLSEECLRWYLPFSILLTEFTILIYVVRTRGWKGAVTSSLRFIGYLLLAATFIFVLIRAFGTKQFS